MIEASTMVIINHGRCLKNWLVKECCYVTGLQSHWRLCVSSTKIGICMNKQTHTLSLINSYFKKSHLQWQKPEKNTWFSCKRSSFIQFSELPSGRSQLPIEAFQTSMNLQPGKGHLCLGHAVSGPQDAQAPADGGQTPGSTIWPRQLKLKAPTVTYPNQLNTKK